MLVFDQVRKTRNTRKNCSICHRVRWELPTHPSKKLPQQHAPPRLLVPASPRRTNARHYPRLFLSVIVGLAKRCGRGPGVSFLYQAHGNNSLGCRTCVGFAAFSLTSFHSCTITFQCLLEAIIYVLVARYNGYLIMRYLTRHTQTRLLPWVALEARRLSS